MVKPIVGTGEFAEVGHQWVFRADVLLELAAPAAVVEGRNGIQVSFYPFKVASLLIDCRVWVLIEGKGEHMLANATLARVSRAGPGFMQVWISERKVQPKSNNTSLTDVAP